jgi:putative endonuclease
MVFVEVKTRTDCAFGPGTQAVTPLKRRRITRLALEYLTHHHLLDCPCRFDVVSIQFDSGHPTIEVYPNAFDAAE